MCLGQPGYKISSTLARSKKHVVIHIPSCLAKSTSVHRYHTYNPELTTNVSFVRLRKPSGKRSLCCTYGHPR